MLMHINKPFTKPVNAVRLYSDHKKFPAFGKQIYGIRCAGLIPAKRVIVTTSWNIGRAFQRIVITGDIPVVDLQFNYLAGLHVQIVHFDRDASILPNLITEILKIQPASLITFNMSTVEFGEPAFKVIVMETCA